MQCSFVVDVDVNPESMTEREKEKVRFRNVKMRGKNTTVPYFPAGTVYEHQNACFFVRQGMATPADKECEKEVDLTAEELVKLQHAYRRQSLGIQPKDWPLFDANVIAGYDEHGEYVHGPKWDEYVASLEAEDEEDEE